MHYESFDVRHRKNLVKMVSSLGSPAVYQREGIGTINTYAIVNHHLDLVPNDFQMQAPMQFIQVSIIKGAIPEVRQGDRIGVANIIYTISHLLNDDGFMLDFVVSKSESGSIPSVPWDPSGTLQKLDGLDYFSFAWGDASPKLLFTITSNRIVSEVVLHVLTRFDGLGTKLQIGDATLKTRLMSELENLPGVEGSYMTHPNYSYSQNSGILLTITPGTGNTQGNGIVEIKYQD
jgi:hypothetical protein